MKNNNVIKRNKNEVEVPKTKERNENIFLKIVKTVLSIIINAIKLGLWVWDQLAEFIVTLEHLVFAKKTKNDDKSTKALKRENHEKFKVKFGMVLCLVIIIGFGYMHHKNATLKAMTEQMQLTDGKTIEDVREAENKIKEASKQDIFGTDSIKTKIGSLDPGYYGKSKGFVRYKTEDGTVKVELTDVYGLGEFTASPKGGTRYVKNVTDYIKSVEPELYQKYFSKVNAPGTTTFTTGWQDFAIDEKETFTKLQFQYLYINYVSPVMDELVKEYNIDKNNNAMKELVFSTSVQYGYKGSLTLFKNAGVKKGEDTKTIIEKVQNEKISAIGEYTYTDEYKYDDIDRKTIKSHIETETQLFLKRL